MLPEEELADGLGIDEDELPDPGAELVLRLIEYRRFRDVARVMRSLESAATRMYTRPPRPLPKPARVKVNALEGVSVRELLDLYLKAVTSFPVEFEHLPEDEVDIVPQMVSVLTQLSRRGRLGFHEFVGGMRASRSVLVATLLAVLELVRRGRISATQPSPFGEIWMFPPRRGTSTGVCPMNLQEAQAAIEAILFAASFPLGLEEIASAVGIDEDSARKLLRLIGERHSRSDSGVILMEAGAVHHAFKARVCALRGTSV